MLVECLVYIAVLTILLSIATASFYFCWDHTRATMSTSDEIVSALHAGELWRADVRAATGKISVVTTAAGQTVEIPVGKRKIYYRFVAGQLLRENPAQKISRRLLPKVKTSEIKTEARDGVTVWCWELELIPSRREAHFPLKFTFLAVQSKP